MGKGTHNFGKNIPYPSSISRSASLTAMTTMLCRRMKRRKNLIVLSSCQGMAGFKKIRLSIKKNTNLILSKFHFQKKNSFKKYHLVFYAGGRPLSWGDPQFRKKRKTFKLFIPILKITTTNFNVHKILSFICKFLCLRFN